MEEAANFIFVYFSLDTKETNIGNGHYEVVTKRSSLSAGFAGTCDPSRQKRIEISFDIEKNKPIYAVSLKKYKMSKDDHVKEIENVFIACFKTENDAKLFVEDLNNKKKNPYLEKGEKVVGLEIVEALVIN